MRTRSGYVWRPSAGFCLLVASWAALFALLAWGWQEPRLDRVQRVLDALALEPTRGIDAQEEQLMATALGRYPLLGPGLTGQTPAAILEAAEDGSARGAQFHLVVLAGGPHRLALTADAPVRVQVEGRELALRPGTELPLALPVAGVSRLVPVRVLDRSNPGVRVVAAPESLAPIAPERDEDEP